jgi:hypothetical protein
MRLFRHIAILAIGLFAASQAYAEPLAIDCQLLVVGGGESAVAAAIQAARLGIRNIVLANDGNWLGGQFTSEGLGAVDEWTKYRDGRVPFPRSGLFLEIMTAIEADMHARYGNSRPGNCFCAWTTCEPQATERLFRRLIEPYLNTNGGPITLVENAEPMRVESSKGRVVQVHFRVDEKDGTRHRIYRPQLTIDASDWGDVVRLAGAKYFAGPDLKDRFHEPSAPTTYDEVEPTEINPITWCLVLRESKSPTIIPRPAGYDESRYHAATTATRDEFQKMGWPEKAMKPFASAWRDTALPKGPYTEGPTVYHHRRLIDRRHNGLAAGTELVLVNWPLQDYPTNRHPKHVAEALEKTEKGASRKNLPELTPAQRRIIFDDAKLHSLGLLHHLQTTVAERDLAAAGNKPIVTFRDLELTDEFGTADRLPPKPYIREGLRTDALYMLREQDVRDTDGNQCWARSMTPDGVFGFQFNIDFHPTKRIFVDDDPAKTWTLVHTKHRNWSTDTDRAMMPLRSLVPSEMNGLIVAGKNLGVSSIVQSAVRLHGHGMLAGQAAATVAVVCLQNDKEPRQVAADLRLIRAVQSNLLDPVDVITRRKPPGVLLWPYHDVPPEADYFTAANRAALAGHYIADDKLPDFGADKRVAREELEQVLTRINAPNTLRDRFAKSAAPPTRRELVMAIEQLMVKRHVPEGEGALQPIPFITPGADSDNDGIPDLEDPLP